jgi:tetratricopeptide (TPR) repeat protein
MGHADMQHIAEHDLALYAFDPSGSARRAEIERHLGECATCRTTADFLRTTEEDLAEAEVWERTIGSATMQSLSAMAEQIAAEDAEAKELLREVLDAPAALAWKKLHTNRKYRTGGVVRKLSARSLEVLTEEPLAALTFADEAIAIAEALPVDIYPASAVFELRGTAWLRRANALRLLGKFPAALDAVRRAEREYERLPAPTLSFADAAYVRGTIFLQEERWADATAAAEQAERGFSHGSSEDGYIRALYLRGTIKREQHASVEAEDLFRRVLAYAELSASKAWAARAAHAIAVCRLDSGDTAAAASHFAQALAGYRRTGGEVECLSAEWGIAQVLSGSGKFVEALGRLRPIAERFERLGMGLEAALVDLDIADALLALGKAREIAALASHVFEVFTQLGIVSGALTAVAYLKEAATSGRVTVSQVRAVRAFLREVQRRPEVIFVSPDAGQDLR